MANGNPFYIQPAGDFSQGLAGLSNTIDAYGERKRAQDKEDAAKEKLKILMQGTLEVYQTGDPNAAMEYSILHPEVAGIIKNAMQFKDRATEENFKNALLDMQMNPSPENMKKVTESRQSFLKQQGVSVEKSKQTNDFSESLDENPKKAAKDAEMMLAFTYADEYKAYQDATGKKEPKDKKTSAIENWEYGKTDPDFAAAQKKGKKEPKDVTPIPTDMDDYVSDAKKAYKLDHDGKEMPPAQVNEKRLEYKRAQADEVASVQNAKKQSELAFSEKISNASKTGTMLAEIANTPELLKAKGEITQVASKEDAANRITGTLIEMADMYLKLDSKNSVINSDKSVVSNVATRFGSSAVGQFLQNAVGTETQSLRNQIKSKQPLLINYIRQASEMGARGLDSVKELEFYLQAATDPTRDFNSNLAAIAVLDNAYGLGKTSAAISNTVPLEVLSALKKQGQSIAAGDKLAKPSGEKTDEELKKSLGL